MNPIFANTVLIVNDILRNTEVNCESEKLKYAAPEFILILTNFMPIFFVQ